MTIYVESREGNLYVGQSRVTLQTLIEAWQSGRTPEQLHDSFPTVPLVAIYGAITYYLEHKDEADAFFRESDELDAQRQLSDESAHAEFYTNLRERFERARARLGIQAS
ncbi:MAG TPA: DUF433 domain-containing protein [Ktedonobacterales bacterium]|jgi:uncharacterized protein (DUF433 family)